MKNDFFTGSHYINSIVGEGTFVTGTIVSNELLRIDGSFRGPIESTGKVLIGKDGRVESFISAETVVVGGIVKGNIKATERIVILTNGVVIGNIKAPRLIIEENVLFRGRCTVSRGGLDNTDEAETVEKKFTEENNHERFNPMRKKSGNG
ncbi:MAG: polymer-forming cytoskeletal protein [Spirochaetia bacterium]|nr:polymer-forming cytoskeletal protein [Spirochaetia bacterium]